MTRNPVVGWWGDGSKAGTVLQRVASTSSVVAVVAAAVSKPIQQRNRRLRQ